VSYILDALKKAAEQRSGPPPEVRRLLSAAPVAAVSASRYVMLGIVSASVIALVAVVWMWAHEVPAPMRTTAKSVASVVAVPSPSEPTQGGRPRAGADDAPRVPLTAIEPARDAAWPPAAGKRAAPAKAPVVEKTAPRTPKPGAVSPVPSTVSPAPGAMSPTPGPVSPAPGPVSPALGAVSPAPTVSPAPGTVSPAPGSFVPAPPVMAAVPPATARSDAGKLKVEVIVYSEQRPLRWAFINGRKYVEGDTIDGARIEEILSNAVVLVEDGRRITLRP
jgi:hypothetical protein